MGAAFGQTAPGQPAFEVASVKPAAPIDMMKMAAAVRGGEMPKIGPHVDGARAEYTYMALRELIATAYKVKPYQITGPDWLASQRFDIVAKLPAGASKDDVPLMLQALLAERFKLVAHLETKEHPVLALVVGKGGPKLKESADVPKAIDDTEPLKPGEMKMDTPDGPVRMTVDTKTGGAVMNMGTKGAVSYHMDMSTQALHMEASMVTMEGLAEMLTQFSQVTGGAAQTVKDMTGLKGYYQIALDLSLADLLNMARAAGMDIPVGAGGGMPGAPGGTGAVAASDPSGGSFFGAVQALGLKLEQRKALVEQLVVEHAEKTPTEN
jgi:uncharacterized protein (TIGR03435 family)